MEFYKFVFKVWKVVEFSFGKKENYCIKTWFIYNFMSDKKTDIQLDLPTNS